MRAAIFIWAWVVLGIGSYLAYDDYKQWKCGRSLTDGEKAFILLGAPIVVPAAMLADLLHDTPPEWREAKRAEHCKP